MLSPFSGVAPRSITPGSGTSRGCGPAPAPGFAGDAQVDNFGSYLGDNGLVYFDVNNFDEALRGPLL